MRLLLQPIAATALCLIGVWLLGATANPNQGTDMNELMQTVRENVEQYDKSKDLLSLRKAGEQLERVDPFAPSNTEQRADVRLQTLNVWLLILLRVDAAKDPRFDPNDPPPSKLAPRSVAGQPPYLPGIDPKQIRDPQVRADYEKAIAENKQKSDRWQGQWDLNAIDMEVSNGAKRFVMRFYTSAPADQNELSKTFAKVGLNAQRQQQLTTTGATKR